jgi:hypothetical protein
MSENFIEQYGTGVTDDCLNCDKAIVSTGIMTNYDEHGDGRSTPSKWYRWTHADTRVSKCDNDSGLYAATKNNIKPPR